MYGANNRSSFVEGAPDTKVGNLVVERVPESRAGAVNGVEDDLLAELGEDAFFGDGELQIFPLALSSPNI